MKMKNQLRDTIETNFLQNKIKTYKLYEKISNE